MQSLDVFEKKNAQEFIIAVLCRDVKPGLSAWEVKTNLGTLRTKRKGQYLNVRGTGRFVKLSIEERRSSHLHQILTNDEMGEACDVRGIVKMRTKF